MNVRLVLAAQYCISQSPLYLRRPILPFWPFSLPALQCPRASSSVAHPHHVPLLRRPRGVELRSQAAVSRRVHLPGDGGALQQQAPSLAAQRHPQERDGAVSRLETVVFLSE